jgi:Tol biopolymer transport system component
MPVPAPDRLRLLLPSSSAYRAVDPSPHGHLLTALREGTEDIFGFALLTLDGTVHELCAREYRYVVNPIWSPRGDAIAFTAAEDEEGTVSGLYVLERSNGAIQRLSGVGYDDIFAWCPDGSRLCVVEETEDGADALWIVVRKGGERWHICNLMEGDTGGEMSPAWPAWSPDGTVLAVSTLPKREEYSVVDFYTATAQFVKRIAWPDAALVRIDDLHWQPTSNV